MPGKLFQTWKIKEAIEVGKRSTNFNRNAGQELKPLRFFWIKDRQEKFATQ